MDGMGAGGKAAFCLSSLLSRRSAPLHRCYALLRGRRRRRPPPRPAPACVTRARPRPCRLVPLRRHWSPTALPTCGAAHKRARRRAFVRADARAVGSVERLRRIRAPFRLRGGPTAPTSEPTPDGSTYKRGTRRAPTGERSIADTFHPTADTYAPTERADASAAPT